MKKRRLLIADIHANLPALEAVLEDAGAVDEVVVAGDIVGYGPHPAECIDLMQRIGALAIAGNHDLEVLLAPRGPERLTEPGTWLNWTLQQLETRHLAYLADLPEEMVVSTAGGEMQVIHHPHGASYLHPDMSDAVLAEHFRGIPGDTVVFGHSHRRIDRMVDGRRLVCLPTVGQPRDGDPRAGYALETAGVLTFHRVDYDVERVVADVEAIRLDPEFTARWVQFMRTGHDCEWSRDYPEE